MNQYILKYIITFTFFIGIDLLWLGFIARPLYVKHLGSFLKTPPNWPVAFLFYGLFVLGLLIYAVQPAIAQGDYKKAILLGALFGFFTYMTYDLTNLATLKDWPSTIVIIDIIWGTCLGASVSGLSALVYLQFFSNNL